MEHIDETLLLRIIENRADDKEKLLFERWIKASEMHAETFAQLKKTYLASSFDTLNKQKNWDAIVRKVNEGKAMPDYIELPAKPASLIGFQMKTLLRIAAIMVLLLGVSFLVKITVFGTKQLTISGNDLQTHEPYQLADGSKVYLNGNSKITFSTDFGQENREITLRGEAFFEVQPNPNIPFYISTGKTTTRVVGTRFNVYSDSLGKVKVTVVSGVVAFYSGTEANGVTLTAGEQAAYTPGLAQIEKEPNPDPNFMAWKTGVLYFNETPILQAFHLLQKQYSRVFVFEADRKSMPTLTTTFDNQTLEAVLEELNLLLNTKNVTRNDTIFFKSNL